MCSLSGFSCLSSLVGVVFLFVFGTCAHSFLMYAAQQTQSTCHSLPLAACRLPPATCYGYYLLRPAPAACSLLPAPCYLLPAAPLMLPASCLLLTSCSLLLAACCLLLTAYCLLLATCCVLLSTFHFPLSTGPLPLATCHLPPATCHLLANRHLPLATCHLHAYLLFTVHSLLRGRLRATCAAAVAWRVRTSHGRASLGQGQLHRHRLVASIEHHT